MIASWYTPKGNETLEAGVFHYEQAMDLKKYCDVALFFPFDKNISEKETVEQEWGLLTYRSKYAVGRILRNRKYMMATMERIMKEFSPDIIHAHCGGGAGYYAVAMAKKYNLPLVITEHTPVEISRVDRKGISRYKTNIAYNNSQANICVSNDSKDKLSKLFPTCTFDVIYNGIILPEYEDTGRKYYKEGYINIVIVAILYDLEIKGLKYLLAAMKKLKEQGKKVYLHHIGAGQYLEHFINMAKELGIDDICTFHGRCERKKLYEIVNEMDFFVSSSLMECSGVSVQEAMLLGKPVLGTNSGGVDSLVPQEAGHIVKKGSSDSLVDGILYMGEHLDSYDREWIRRYAYESFEIDHISRKYVDLYERLKNENDGEN